jgi:hypothetical protein
MGFCFKYATSEKQEFSQAKDKYLFLERERLALLNLRVTRFSPG